MFNLKLIATALAATMLAGGANAHASLEVQEAVQGQTYKGTMRIGHGCDGQATLKVQITIPEGVYSVKPMAKAGWQIETVRGDYAQTYTAHGKEVTEGVQEIIWTGELPDAFFDEFTFRGTVSDTISADTVIYFPTVQTCADGSLAWSEIPSEGQDPRDLARPAPRLKVIAGAAHH